MYLLAILFPPLAVLFSGKPIQALLNCGLLLLGGIPAIIHAILVVKEKKADNRAERQVKMINKEVGKFGA